MTVAELAKKLREFSDEEEVFIVHAEWELKTVKEVDGKVLIS